MARLGAAIRLFFKVLGSATAAEQARRFLAAPGDQAPIPAKPAAAAPAPAARSDALTLLELLQREARLVDFLKEPIDAYSDQQVGAAVRDVHRGAAAILDRVFGLRPVMEQAEGSTVQVPAGADVGRVRLVGAVSGQPPFNGTLRHGGWRADRVELPTWTGAKAAADVVAPAEVEIA